MSCRCIYGIDSSLTQVNGCTFLGMSALCLKRANITKMGIFLGLSQQHASEVPLVLNLGTGAITNQFNVVFDDIFTTMPSIKRETEPPEHWEDFCLENSTQMIVDAPVENMGDDEWLAEEELETKRQRQN
jgi:hypothetical protein